jgi:hypothetical protein
MLMFYLGPTSTMASPMHSMPIRTKQYKLLHYQAAATIISNIFVSTKWAMHQQAKSSTLQPYNLSMGSPKLLYCMRVG